MNYTLDKSTNIILCEPDCAEEWLTQIWEIGFDYDGYNDVKNLKELIDEIVADALKARQCLYDKKIYKDMEQDLEKYKVVKKMKEANNNEIN